MWQAALAFAPHSNNSLDLRFKISSRTGNVIQNGIQSRESKIFAIFIPHMKLPTHSHSASTEGQSGWGLVCVWDNSGSESFAAQISLAISGEEYFAAICGSVNHTLAPWADVFRLSIIFKYNSERRHSPAQAVHASWRSCSFAVPGLLGEGRHRTQRKTWTLCCI